MESNPKIEVAHAGRSGSPPKLFGFYLAPPVSHRPLRPAIQCRFCDRTFFNSQSFGGHQNAHKKERDQIRRIRQLMPQKIIVPRARFAAAASSQPPSVLARSPRVGHLNPCSGFTRVYLKEEYGFSSSIASNFHESIHVESGDGSSNLRVEDVNVDLRL